MYPNLSVLLTLSATLPVTSCKCERSFFRSETHENLVKSIRNHKESSIINNHHGFQIDYKPAVKIFLELHPRKLNVSDLILDEE